VGVWDQAMGKVRWRSVPRLQLALDERGRKRSMRRGSCELLVDLRPIEGALVVSGRGLELRTHSFLTGPAVTAGGLSLRWTDVSSCCLLPRWRAGHRFVAAPEDLDDAHRAATAGTGFAQGERDDLGN
jgi:hypothetical protein